MVDLDPNDDNILILKPKTLTLPPLEEILARVTFDVNKYPFLKGYPTYLAYVEKKFPHYIRYMNHHNKISNRDYDQEYLDGRTLKLLDS